MQGGGTISSRKELNNAAKEFFLQWKEDSRLSPDEYKQAVKESQKLSSITYPSSKAAVSQEFMGVLMSSVISDDHTHFTFFQEEQKKLKVGAEGGAGDASTAPINGEEGDAAPARSVAALGGGSAAGAQHLGGSGKRTLAGLKAHMRQAKERIEATKALIRAEEQGGGGGVSSLGAVEEVIVVGESGGAASSGGGSVVIVDGFATAVGSDQVSSVSSSVFGSVEAVVGGLATSVLAPTTTYNNGDQVYSGVILVSCADLPSARKVSELVAEKTAAGDWEKSLLPSSGTPGPRVVETKTSGGTINLRQLGEMIARDRATKVVLSSNSNNGVAPSTGTETEVDRQKRGRE